MDVTVAGPAGPRSNTAASSALKATPLAESLQAVQKSWLLFQASHLAGGCITRSMLQLKLNDNGLEEDCRCNNEGFAELKSDYITAHLVVIIWLLDCRWLH